MPLPPIRLATEADAPRLAAIYAPHVNDGVASFEQVAPDAAAMAQRVADTLRRWPWLVWDEGDGALGYAYASTHAERAAYQWSVNVSVYVDRAAHRRGMGRALYGVLLPVLARQGAVTALAGITVPNDASVGLHRAMGFEPVGVYPRVGYKRGAWHDVAWMSRPLPDPWPVGEPPAPQPLSALLAAGALRDLSLG